MRIKKLKLLVIKGLLQRIIDKITLKAECGGISTSELVQSIFEFCQICSGVKYYPYQEQFGKRIIRSILENDGLELTALFARQMGKSETVANTVGGLMIILPVLANLPMFVNDKRLTMFKDGFWVGIFAPSLRQAQTTYNRLKARIQSDSALEVLAELQLEFSTSNGQTVALTNGSFATAVSASDGSNIEGDSYKLIICEECQDISNYKIRKSIHPMGASYNATIVKIGTATTFKGDFYEAIQRNKRDFADGRLKLKSHFEYDWKVGAKYNPKYEKYVQKEMYRLGETSDEFRMSYCLEWILSRGMFVDIDYLEKTCGAPDVSRVFFDRTKEHVVGIDLAKRNDSTVITVVEPDWDNPVIREKNKNSVDNIEDEYYAYNTMIKDWKQLEGDDYNQQYYEILSYIQNYRVVRIMIDATREESMSDRLRANLDCEVIGCNFTTIKSPMYKHLDTEIKSGRARFPMTEEVKKSREYMEFSKQMGMLQKDYRGQAMVVSHPPERGAHDDYCLSANTEILTKRGFLKYNELTSNDLVAKVVDNKIIYVKPTKVIVKNYCGDMYRFSAKDLCLEVTENHKMLVRHRKSGREKILLSQDLAKIEPKTLYNTLSIPVAPIQEKEDYPISDEMIQLTGWFITEGWINQDIRYNTYRYSFGQSKKNPQYNNICKIIDRLGLEPYVYTRKDEVTYWTFHKKDNELFDSILSEGIHRIPRKFLNELSQRQLRLLLDTLMYGDGTISRNTYSTNSLELAQDFQELAHKLGIKTSIRKNTNKDGYVMYYCYLMRKDETRITKVEKYHYDDIVWCVNVNNGFILTRCDNKISVTGNCDSWALAVYGCRERYDNYTVEQQDHNQFFIKQNNNYYNSVNRRTARRRR